MKKILLIHRSLGIGGAEKIFAFVSNCLAQKFQVKILLLSDEKPTLYLDKAIEIEMINCYMDLPIIGKKMYTGLKGLFHMSKIILNNIRKYDPEVIVCFDLRIILALGLQKKSISAKLLFSERADPFENSIYWKFILKQLYKKIDYIVFQTKQAREFYGEIVNGKSCVLANPAFSRVGIKTEQNINDRNNIIFAAGRFQSRKGFDLLIKAFARIANTFPTYNLILYGKGEENNNLIKLIDLYKLNNRVIIKNPINGVVEKNKMARLFVIPSRSEGIPNILIEAMMEGIPCVATNCSPGGAKMISDNGKYCLLANNDDVESLAEKMKIALENPKEMEKIALKAKESMIRFDPKTIGEEWINIINILI